MTVPIAAALLALGFLATVVVLTRDPARQVLVFGAFGWTLALAFLLLSAPDVALSELVVGGIALPLMLLVTLTRVGRTGR